MEKVNIKIDGKDLAVEAGKTILDIAKENNIDVPHLCYHPDVETAHHCGMCLVGVKGEDGLVYSCKTVVKEGMEIITDSGEINAERKKNLDKMLKKHLLECDDCVWMSHCKLLELVKKFEAKPIAQKNEEDKVLQVGKIVFDQTKCIGCENCVNVCPTHFLELDERGRVVPSQDKNKECINCGQCILHCPVGAIEGAGEFEELENVFADKKKTAVVQFAPSIRTSIGEEFGIEAGKIMTGQLVAALKKLGFDFVFDTATGADFTTMEESDELIERTKSGKNLPAMTSCCPAWVKFLEFYYPEFIPNLCTSRSPQAMLGGIVKNYWAKLNNLQPQDIFMVSIMPCVAKKYEIKREELKIDGVFPVDMVLTTRELVRMIKKNGIKLDELDEMEADNPLGEASGAGVIYGSSGGVFESALRTAYYKVSGENLPNEMIKEVRGTDNGVKVKEVELNGKKIRVCVVSGIKNAKKVLDNLKENPDLYQAVEVMACPGGCIGGGGQSLPTTKEIIKKRSQSLYNIDDKKEIKRAHENKSVQKVYDEFFASEEVRKKILHTYFDQKNKTEIKQLRNSRETL